MRQYHHHLLVRRVFPSVRGRQYRMVTPTENQERNLATSIYYLLTHDNPSGVIHMNKSIVSWPHHQSSSLRHRALQTYHVLHQGRAEYTLIAPGINGAPPVVTTAVMGPNTAAGETRTLLVGTSVWKMSRLLPEDLALGRDPETADKVGCLITEVVVPGFYWEDHAFLTQEGLHALFKDVDGREELIKQLAPHVKKSEGRN
jgi:uncharacterized protein